MGKKKSNKDKPQNIFAYTSFEIIRGWIEEKQEHTLARYLHQLSLKPNLVVNYLFTLGGILSHPQVTLKIVLHILKLLSQKTVTALIPKDRLYQIAPYTQTSPMMDLFTGLCSAQGKFRNHNDYIGCVKQLAELGL
ncbi:MAG TPA: hypothetical protein VHD33_07795, partial [Legionellaceae bacterium]|nr:hypothetical protein [Legionellaceae bacterium]